MLTHISYTILLIHLLYFNNKTANTRGSKVAAIQEMFFVMKF